jgi:uncharacterized membrane protein
MATDYVTPLSQEGWNRNVGEIERMVSIGVGLGIAIASIWAKGTARRAMAMTGTTLALRGAAGWCPVYATAGVNHATGDTWAALSGPRGLHVRDQIIVRGDIDSVFRYWRDFSHLPQLMDHLESVTPIDEQRSHWVARGPFGLRVEWDAEIINEIPNRLIGWRSLPGADMVSAGSVRFRETPSGVEVSVHFQYSPPAASAGAALAWFFGETPAQELHEGLRRLRDHFESTMPIPPRETGSAGSSAVH